MISPCIFRLCNNALHESDRTNPGANRSRTVVVWKASWVYLSYKISFLFKSKAVFEYDSIGNRETILLF